MIFDWCIMSHILMPRRQISPIRGSFRYHLTRYFSLWIRSRLSIARNLQIPKQNNLNTDKNKKDPTQYFIIFNKAFFEYLFQKKTFKTSCNLFCSLFQCRLLKLQGCKRSYNLASWQYSGQLQSSTSNFRDQTCNILGTSTLLRKLALYLKYKLYQVNFSTVVALHRLWHVCRRFLMRNPTCLTRGSCTTHQYL